MTTGKLAAFGGWLAAFSALLLMKWWTLRVPASWDASWTVFAGGSTLASNGFDLLSLLEAPSFRDYGPGTHATSPVTWLTGLMIAIFGEGEALLPALHVVHLMIGGVALQQIYRYARGVWRPLPSLVAVAVTATIPLVSAQFGFMYLETPQLAAMMLAIGAFERSDYDRSGAWAALGVAVKASGIVIPLALAATMIVLDRSKTRWSRVALVVGPALGVVALIMATRPPLGFDDRTFADFVSAGALVVAATPDLVLLLGLVLVFAPSALRPGKLDSGERLRVVLALWCTIGFGAFYVLLPALGFPFTLLPRYLVLILPAVVVGAGVIVQRVFGRGLLAGGVAVFLIVGLVNHAGTLYPQSDVANTVFQERSNGYAGLLVLVAEGFEHLERAGDIPVVVDPNQWARGRYPAAGYVAEPLSNMLQLDAIRDGTSVLPDEFLILDAEVASSRLPDLIEELESNPAWSSRETVLEDGRFRIRLLRFSKG